MARNFYFGSDASMVSGSAVFSSLINADAAAFGLSEERALAYAQIDAALQSAYQAAITPITRSPVAIAHKDVCMKSMQRMASSLSMVLHATPAVTDAQLISLGLLRRPKRTRRNAPDEPPMIRVLSVRGRVVNIRVFDGNVASGRRKAFGAVASEIFSYVGEQAPADIRHYHLEGVATRTTKTITFPNDIPTAATIWLSARWVTKRGETSIGSSPVNFTLQGGAIGAEATRVLRAAA